MTTCKLCLEREANKKNTHYLTDAIIRPCLNIDGSAEREKGFYFILDNANPFIDFNFQRLSELTLEKVIGRQPTEEEIEKARSIPFSENYIFCNVCEERFSEIENRFLTSILPHLRNVDLSNRRSLAFDDYSTCRSFFYIQIYRSGVCESILSFSPEFVERLRYIIYSKVNDNSIPLSVTYLQTLGGSKSFTENYVGFTDDRNPYLIFMNDIIIQVFESTNDIRFQPFYGLNDADTFQQNINVEEKQFLINVFNDEQRKQLFRNIIKHEKVATAIQQYKEMFNLFWRQLFNTNAPTFHVERYLYSLTHGEQNSVLKYTKEEVYNFTVSYMINLFGIKE